MLCILILGDLPPVIPCVTISQKSSEGLKKDPAQDLRYTTQKYACASPETFRVQCIPEYYHIHIRESLASDGSVYYRTIHTMPGHTIL